MPRGGTHFRCRSCHSLKYDSRQNGHRNRAFLETELDRAMCPFLNRVDATIKQTRWPARD